MGSRRTPFLLIAACIAWGSPKAVAQTPVTGHYPPGQSGIRGAVTPEAGLSYTNFSRFFTNLEMVGSTGASSEDMSELRYANISMFTWTTNRMVFGMRFGALAGVPVATGDISAGGEDSGFGLGDILITPLSLYGRSASFDYQFQFTVWTPSGYFSPGSARNRGTGFWALIYSLGGVFYPGGDRDGWSVSLVVRTEQNFEQRLSKIGPGDDVVVDWGVGRVARVLDRRLDAGLSGFGVWQLTAQQGGPAVADHQRYRLMGVGPEASLSLADALALRVRAHWEFAARSIVRGNNLWIIFNYQIQNTRASDRSGFRVSGSGRPRNSETVKGSSSRRAVPVRVSPRWDSAPCGR